MGNTVARSFLRSSVPSKRKAFSVKYGSEEQDFEDDMFTPKRRKIMSTSKYIYKALFEEGQGSDIKIVALDKEWNLHKIYLSQSPYFNSMFNGMWVETAQNEIKIGIEDENITPQALHKVFGSLYQDEIQIQPCEAVSILACATLLQLDDLIHQSVEVMKDSINIDTALSYYEAAELYGLKEIKSISLDWLHKNLLTTIYPSCSHLQQISCDLMAELLSSPHLVVVQTEFSAYLMLRQWVFLREYPFYKNYEAVPVVMEEYFKKHTETMPYLVTNCGISYQKAFRALRLKYLVVHHYDMEVIEADNIIPVEWFMPIFKMQWYQMLRVEQGVDRGPKQVTDEDFEKDCARCGRILKTDLQHSWRWTGFNFGFDIVIYYTKRAFKLRRFLKTDNDPHNINSSELSSRRSDKRHLMYRFGVYSLDKNGRVIFKGETKIETVSLNENEEVTVLNFHSDMKFPLLVSANFLLTTPLRSSDDAMPAIRQT